MRRSVILALVALTLSPGAASAQSALNCTTPVTASDAAECADGAVRAILAVQEAERPDADTARDDARHLWETLSFAQVRPGQRVADMIMGGGYFTRVFAAAVGPEGHVTAWQPEEFVAFGANYGAAVTAADAMANVDGMRSPIGAPELGSDLDLVFTAQNYHDLHLKAFPTDTAAKVNAAAFAALKPGGIYVIVDHDAAAGTGLAAADSLHRIDVEAVKAEVEAAGFVLDGESAVLANPDDPRTASVFDPSIRGRTSQFMLRFRKPA